MKVELAPDMDHCIETVARREFRDVLRKLLSAEGVGDESKEKEETLRLFLQVADFRKLRAESEEHLRQGKRVSFCVYREDDSVKYEMVTS